MLNHLYIRDLAIVSALELELAAGLSVLTGETGAGKSILIDALGLVLGDRADNSMIRSGCERAEIAANFDLSQLPNAISWLQEQALDEHNECLIRRILSREGRSRAFINGHPVAIQQVQELGNLLVEIHGQHAHQSLLKLSHQRRLLDAYGGHLELVEQVASRFKLYRDSQHRLDELKSAKAERANRLELLRFQANELTNLKVTEEELGTLDKDHNRLSHLEQLQSGCIGILNSLDEYEPSVRGLLVKITDQLGALQRLDEKLHEPLEMLDSALIQVDESLSLLRDYLADLELDPDALHQLEQRLEAIQDMARKYRVKPAELPDRLAAIHDELQQLETAEVNLHALDEEVTAQWQEYLRLAEQLRAKRQAASTRLGQEISEAIQQLGMPGGLFSVQLKPLPEENPRKDGLEQVQFMVSTNPGMPQQPLNKVASGGELSRISLAIQVATIRYGMTPTLVFDEVDVGIGGGVAEIVGQMLRKLANTRQILCVTHLAQVAAQAENHLHVHKSTTDRHTHTRITTLNEAARIQEIARMLGGLDITSQTLAHAREMVSLAASD
jgi:DNA repair protein RecN (Recombination protein N)